MPGDSKAEELTHLYGSRLVEKDNPVIRLRGRLDTLAAMILEAQLVGEEQKNRGFVDDLQETLGFVRNILSAEYSGTPLPKELKLLGMTSAEIRGKSHHPDRYFGRGHFMPDYSMGALSVRLNLLRTAVRETELAAVSAFKNPTYLLDTPDPKDPKELSKSRRGDIIEALNRLSSLFYILMYKYLPENCSQKQRET